MKGTVHEQEEHEARRLQPPFFRGSTRGETYFRPFLRASFILRTTALHTRVAIEDQVIAPAHPRERARFGRGRR
jgi:hypothetical protein